MRYLLFLCLFTLPLCAAQSFVKPQMYYTDETYGRPLAKDPDVITFNGNYFMYYSVNRGEDGWAVGIAKSNDLVRWQKVCDLLPDDECEKRGLAAPAAIVLDERVHLFYQTYGNGSNDAICHAVSEDGVHFTRNPTNPIFAPTGKWNVGRAIDADVIVQDDRLLLYWATRDPQMKKQMIGVSAAPLDSGFVRSAWQQLCDAPILEPQLPWEQLCIEAPAVVAHKGKWYMFYAGAYNNAPQQIGCALSDDGILWKRLSDKPVLPNGAAGEWNCSESGHPGIFTDDDGSMYLFFQGNNDNGKTWYLSKMLVQWQGANPILVSPQDNNQQTSLAESQK